MLPVFLSIISLVVGLSTRAPGSYGERVPLSWSTDDGCQKMYMVFFGRTLIGDKKRKRGEFPVESSGVAPIPDDDQAVLMFCTDTRTDEELAKLPANERRREDGPWVLVCPLNTYLFWYEEFLTHYQKSGPIKYEVDGKWVTAHHPPTSKVRCMPRENAENIPLIVGPGATSCRDVAVPIMPANPLHKALAWCSSNVKDDPEGYSKLGKSTSQGSSSGADYITITPTPSEAEGTHWAIVRYRPEIVEVGEEMLSETESIRVCAHARRDSDCSLEVMYEPDSPK